MPYEMRKKGNQYCVYNKDTGESKGCSDTRAMAVKHMRALYANSEKSAEKAWHPDASYLGRYISYCNSLIEEAQYSFQYSDSEHEQLADFSEALIDTMTGYLERLIQWRNEWYGSANFKAADVPGLVASEVEKAVKARFTVDSMKGFLSESQPVVAFKQADGRVRVMMRVSNNFKDRHNEIITEAAHKEYEAYVKESGDYPEFRLWHVPASRWGQADLVSFDDGFLTVSGLADPGWEEVALNVASDKEMGVSHGFKGISVLEGEVNWYRMFESSPLPRAEAANYWTNTELVKQLEKGMALAEKHKTFFASLGVPAEKIAQWDTETKSLQGMLKEAGIEFKELGDGTEQPTETGASAQTQPQTTAQSTESSSTEQVEVTLPDGSKALVPAESVQRASDPMSGAPDWAKALMGRLGSIEEKNKELEAGLKGLAANGTDSWEAAIRQGSGFVASKEGSAPSNQETQAQDEWEKQLAAFLTGGTN